MNGLLERPNFSPWAGACFDGRFHGLRRDEE